MPEYASTGESKQMKNVLIYCAGGYGEKVAYSLDDSEYSVIGFLDEKEEKIGRSLLGKPVIHPRELSLIDYDLVIISLPEHEKVIKEKLTSEYDVIGSTIAVFGRYDAGIEWADERIVMLRKCIAILKERNIPGNTAELGVYRGDFSRIINKHLSERKLYLFDTFEGFCSDRDSVRDVDQNMFKDTSADFVLERMPHPEQCIIKKGYFPSTTKDVIDKFCLVSLDADLYEPILSGLEFFYPRLNKGGYIFVHDFDSIHFPGVKNAVYEFCDNNRISFVPISDKCSSVIITK